MNRLALCLLAPWLLLAGCAVTEPLPRYFVLTPPGSGGGAGAGGGARVFIRAVNVPGYLHPSQLVTRRRGQQIEYAPAARWAEGLGEGIKRGLAAALTQQRGIGAVTAAPYGVAPGRDYDLKLDVERFEGDDAGEAVAVIRWTLSRPESADPIVSQASRQVRTGWKVGDEAGLARLLSEALGGVAEDIARGVRRAAR